MAVACGEPEDGGENNEDETEIIRADLSANYVYDANTVASVTVGCGGLRPDATHALGHWSGVGAALS